MEIYLVAAAMDVLSQTQEDIVKNITLFAQDDRVSLSYIGHDILTISSNYIELVYDFHDGKYIGDEKEAIKILNDRLFQLPGGLRPNLKDTLKIAYDGTNDNITTYLINDHPLYYANETYIFNNKLYPKGTYQTLCEDINEAM